MDGPGVVRLDPDLISFLDEVSLDRTQVAFEIVASIWALEREVQVF
jgi:hypothetical protein